MFFRSLLRLHCLGPPRTPCPDHCSSPDVWLLCSGLDNGATPGGNNYHWKTSHRREKLLRQLDKGEKKMSKPFAKLLESGARLPYPRVAREAS